MLHIRIDLNVNRVQWEHEGMSLLRSMSSKLNAIGIQLGAISKGVTEMAGEVQELQDEVAALTDEVDGAELMLDKLMDLVEANQSDPVALKQIVTDIRAQRTQLAEAVLRNTPSDPNPTPTPPNP